MSKLISTLFLLKGIVRHELYLLGSLIQILLFGSLLYLLVLLNFLSQLGKYLELLIVYQTVGLGLKSIYCFQSLPYLFSNLNLEGAQNGSSIIDGKGGINSSNTNDQFGFWLAGLIESDGSILVPEVRRDVKGRLRYPAIKIVFHIEDLPLAQHLIILLGGGTIETSKGNWCVLWIRNIVTLHKVITLINGKMRTPKIEALHRMILWFNEGPDLTNFPLLGLDTCPILSNSWLAGFIDGDGNFHFDFSLNAQGICMNVNRHFSMELRQEYHRASQFAGTSYLPFISMLATALRVKVYSRARGLNGKVYSSYTVISGGKASIDTLIDYFNKFPLFSSKYLNYLNFVRVHQLIITKQYLTEAGSLEIQALKNNHNRNRTIFTWAHLNNLTI